MLPQAQGYLPVIDPHSKMLLFWVVLASRGQQTTGTKLQAAVINNVQGDGKLLKRPL